MRMNKIYYLGGSPCSGKSTVAELLAVKYNFLYFKLDERLNEYIEKGKLQDKTYIKRYFSMSPDEIWLRAPAEQNREEMNIYHEIFEYAVSDIKNLSEDKPVIAEGAGFLPELMKKIGVTENEYICITPTKDFQYEKYSQRTWIHDILKDCSDKKLAFENWMERDALFALEVNAKAEELGYHTIIVDGKSSIEGNFMLTEKIFNLG